MTFADYINLIVWPRAPAALMPINGLFWIIWWLLISIQLLRLTRGIAKEQV